MTATNMCSNFCGFRCRSTKLNYVVSLILVKYPLLDCTRHDVVYTQSTGLEYMCEELQLAIFRIVYNIVH